VPSCLRLSFLIYFLILPAVAWWGWALAHACGSPGGGIRGGVGELGNEIWHVGLSICKRLLPLEVRAWLRIRRAYHCEVISGCLCFWAAMLSRVPDLVLSTPNVLGVF
jgi:hypothetical protein